MEQSSQARNRRSVMAPDAQAPSYAQVLARLRQRRARWGHTPRPVERARVLVRVRPARRGWSPAWSILPLLWLLSVGAVLIISLHARASLRPPAPTRLPPSRAALLDTVARNWLIARLQ